MITRLKYRKFGNKLSGDCWFCSVRANKILVYPDGSECWCCPRCFIKKGKIRTHNSQKSKQTIISSNSLVENQEKGIKQEVLQI